MNTSEYVFTHTYSHKLYTYIYHLYMHKGHDYSTYIFTYTNLNRDSKRHMSLDHPDLKRRQANRILVSSEANFESEEGLLFGFNEDDTLVIVQTIC